MSLFLWPPDVEDIPTFTIEMAIFIAGIAAAMIAIFIFLNYRKLAKQGLPECIVGFFIFAFHSLFDALDTICEVDLLKDNLDFMDSYFSIIGLILIGIGILRISIYGAKIWKEL